MPAKSSKNRRARWFVLAVATTLIANSTQQGSGQDWVRLIPAGNLPEGRVGATSVHDPIENSMILFAGHNNIGNCGTSCLFNDVWVLKNPNAVGGLMPEWVALSPTGPPPSRRTSHASVYDAMTNRMTVFGGSGNIGSCGGLLNDVWVLHDANGLGTPRWQPITPAGPSPSARRSHACVYDPSTNRMIMYGGSPNCGTQYNDTWVLKDANGTGSPEWLPLSPIGGPPPIGENSVAYDAASNRLIVWVNCCDVILNPELWILEHANGLGGTPAWIEVATSGQKPIRRGPSISYLGATNELVLFGGLRLDGTRSNEVFLLSNANGTGVHAEWTQLMPNPDPVSGLPRGRGAFTSIVDPVSQRITFFGGTEFNFSNGDDFNDTWVLIPPERDIPVELDIKPGSEVNPVNLKSKGRLPVALLTDELFEASEVDPLSILFGDPSAIAANGGAPVVPIDFQIEDVDLDGDLDVILHFSVSEIVSEGALDNLSESALISGRLVNGPGFFGEDAVRIK